MLTVGATISGGVYVTVSVAVATLFAASRAVTVTTFVPGCRTTPPTDHADVPVAVPEPPRSLVPVTCVTPTLSAAVPLTLNGDDVVAYVAPFVGPVMLTVGAVTSGGTTSPPTAVAMSD